MAGRRRRSSVQAEDVILPADMRREASFRNYADRSRGVLACGFVVKPNVTNDIIGQTTREYVAVYVLRGRGAYVDWRGASHTLEAGDLLQRIPGKRHSTILDPDSNWAEVYLVLHTDFYRTLVRFGSLRDDVPVLRPGLHRSLVDRFEEILRDLQSMPERSPSHTLLKAHGLMLDICAFDAARREPDRYAEIVQVSCALLSENLSERLSVPAVAESFHMSYERFRKVFKERVGMAPGDYRIRRRVELACRLLVQERAPAKQVAYDLGYADEYCFSKQFRKFIGVSPDAFRKGMR